MAGEVHIVAGSAREEIAASLTRAGIPSRAITAVEAMRVAPEQVICERGPGWEALAASLSPRSAFVLLGRGPTPEERRRMAGADVEVAAGPEEVPLALRRAVDRARAARPSPVIRVLNERMETIALVDEFAQAIARQGDLRRVVAEAIARTRDLCEADGASLLLVDNETGELHFEAVAGERADRVVQIRLAPGKGIAGKVARSAAPLCVPDVAAEPSFDASADQASGFRTGSIVAVPLLIGGDLVGVLEAVRSRDRAPFGTAELKRLELLAPHVAIAVHNGQITAELRRTQAQVLDANQVLEQRVVERTRQISNAKREWEKTFDAISQPISLLDGHTVRRANLSYARTTGTAVQAVPGKRCHQLMAGRDTPCPGCPLLAGGNAEVQMGEHVFDVTAFAMDGATRVVTYRDVTHERALEARLRESERLAAVGQLASGAAHEINNPLGFLSANLQALQQNLRDLAEMSGTGAELVTESAEIIGDALAGARRVGDIVRGLRELSRLEIGGHRVTRVNDSVTRAVRAELDGKAQVEIAVPDELAVWIDPLQFDQVLAQILRNARQAISSQGRVRLSGWEDSGQVHLRIEDDGNGIAPEHLRRVFEPFFTTRGVGQGVGLGLTAAWGIVTRFGGHIDVESEPGRGAAFTIRMPTPPPTPEVRHGTAERAARLG
ncbi:MAG TPA: ATP-binding protein [Myxococcaceae bacterium]|nr:ATP-binding protein [Myxococcaceae bacterium]